MNDGANFDHLRTEAQQLGAELSGEPAPGAADAGSDAGPAPGAPPPSSQQLAARDVRAMLEVMVKLLAPISARAAAVYDDNTMTEVSEAVGAVLVKHGISVFSVLGRFETEIKCAIVLTPVVWATVVAMRDDLEAKAAAAARPLNAQPRAHPDPMYS